LHDFPLPATEKPGLGRLQPLAAGGFAAAAGLGAFLAMLHVCVLAALVAAGLADFGALAQQVRGVLRAASHVTGREGADVGTVAVEANAAHHHFHVVFLQAGSGAMLAGGDAGIESVEEGLVLGMHGEGGMSRVME